MNKLKTKIVAFGSAAAIFALPLMVSATELYSPISEDITVPQLIGRLLSIIIGVIGAIALAVFIYGGFLWMTSAGNGKKVEDGKNTMIWAVLGLVIIFSARAILAFVFNALLNKG